MISPVGSLCTFFRSAPFIMCGDKRCQSFAVEFVAWLFMFADCESVPERWACRRRRRRVPAIIRIAGDHGPKTDPP